MQRSLSVLLLSLAVCHLTSASTAAQDQSQPPANLALQIFYAQSPTPQYASVDHSRADWYGLPPRIPSWREPEGKLPVQSVRVSRYRVGEQVVVRVEVARGDKFSRTPEFVAEHRARLDESVTVSELAKFGFEPFRFRVVRRLKAALPDIGVANLTRSIRVSSAEATDDKQIGVKIALRNLSPKKVKGLELHMLRGGRSERIALPLGTRGRVIIVPGGEYRTVLLFEGPGEEVAGGYVPAMPETFKVTSVLFADGSHEGEVLPAARGAASLAGERAQLVRVIGLAERALASPDLHTPEAVARFRARVSELGYEADPSVVERLAASYPGLDAKEQESLKDPVEFEMYRVRESVLVELAVVERQISAGRNDKLFREWLTSKHEFFEKWLGSLTR